MLLAEFKVGNEDIKLIHDKGFNQYEITFEIDNILMKVIPYKDFDTAKVEFNQQMHFRVNRL